MLYHSDITDDQHKIEFVEALIDAFKQIDVNGDETLEWDEFSNYIVETGKILINHQELLDKRKPSSMLLEIITLTQNYVIE
jgi:hypothetical protein